MLIVCLVFALLITAFVWINLICCQKSTSKACFCFDIVCKDLGKRWLSFVLIFINAGDDFWLFKCVVLLPKWDEFRTPGKAGKCKEIDISELEIRD